MRLLLVCYYFNALMHMFLYSGVADLKSGVIVTPLPPKATFLDDPLRVLRAIRFGNDSSYH